MTTIMKPMLNVEEIINFNTTHNVFFYPGAPLELRGYVHEDYGAVTEYTFITRFYEIKTMIINANCDTFYHKLTEYLNKP
jgi:hypothetical protein